MQAYWVGEVECILYHGVLYYKIIYKCQYTFNTWLIHHNNNEFNCYVVQFHGLAEIASHKKKKELIDKEVIIVGLHACVYEKFNFFTKLPYFKIN